MELVKKVFLFTIKILKLLQLNFVFPFHISESSCYTLNFLLTLLKFNLYTIMLFFFDKQFFDFFVGTFQRLLDPCIFFLLFDFFFLGLFVLLVCIGKIIF